MKKFAAIFDMDGTMINNTPYNIKAWDAIYKKYGLGNFDPQIYYSEISGIPIIVTIRRLFGDTHDEAGLWQLVKEKEALYRKLYAPYLGPVNGLENFLIQLKNADIKTAIASSATADDINFILSHIPVRDYFDVIVDGNRVDKPKPHPDIFLKAAEEMNAQPEDCVVFEDSLAGIKAGNAAGMKVVGITTSHQPGKLQPTNLTIADFTELSAQKLEALFK